MTPLDSIDWKTPSIDSPSIVSACSYWIFIHLYVEDMVDLLGVGIVRRSCTKKQCGNMSKGQ